jgi:hypothetical protein
MAHAIKFTTENALSSTKRVARADTSFGAMTYEYNNKSSAHSENIHAHRALLPSSIDLLDDRFSKSAKILGLNSIFFFGSASCRGKCSNAAASESPPSKSAGTLDDATRTYPAPPHAWHVLIVSWYFPPRRVVVITSLFPPHLPHLRSYTSVDC